MMEKRLKFINATTADWHDDVASINEEFVDGEYKEVMKLCRGLIKKINHFKSNLNKEV